MEKIIRIHHRFCGPPTSGNGGYTSGLISQAMATTAEITLRRPIPIDADMRLMAEEGKHRLKLADEVIAEAIATDVQKAEVPAIGFDEATDAAERSPAFKDHPFPTCFVCGPQRAEGDGLRIFPGRITLAGREFFAAPWQPQKEFADSGSGKVRDEIIWAALDCPTGFAGGFPYNGKLVTGRMAAKVFDSPLAGESCVLLSWADSVEGRKHHSSAALLGEDGRIRAQARATWIKLD